jgi:low temperature requirement protein LtrA
VWWIYFDNVAESKIRWGGFNAIAWLYTHLFFQLGITAMGVGIYKMVTRDVASVLPENYRWLICGSVALVLVTMGLIELTTVERRGDFKNHIEFIVRVLGAVFVLVLGVVGASMNVTVFMILVAVPCVAQVVLDLYRRGQRPSEHVKLATGD